MKIINRNLIRPFTAVIQELQRQRYIITGEEKTNFRMRRHPGAIPFSATTAGIPGQVSQSQGSQQQILIKSRGPSWIVACADGKPVFEKLIKDGDTDRFNFSSRPY